MVVSIHIETEEKITSEMKNVFLKRASIKRNKLSEDMQLKKVLDENIFKMGHILLDLHEAFNIQPEYEPLTEFEHFKTVGDIKTYLENRTA
ncbi:MULTISPECIES: hypothetical protein [Bacillus cereus group]|uniref:Acyl carrier protein n=2 Tax=Bacillus cereus group TaxID=86661 RepID=A0A9X6SS91_BACCE|nr:MULTISPECIES: hypothetical protein [Bacillus cereus group]MDA1674551.1 hypothetical protein [Bacillus cereus group sp. TH152-1LC]PDZ94255.1 hypothetical protein CON36_34780 [Bacillus cereus]PFJ30266.1 hypothetical protein COJ15_31155 [Bacillus thuringiensis]PGP12491.1 hypothetical protein COA01_32250 [Bacillus cereus]